MLFVNYCVVIITVLLIFTFGASLETSLVEVNCECIPFYFCKNKTINISDSYTVDVRMKSLKSKECAGYWESCCDEEDKLLPLTQLSAPPPKLSCGHRNYSDDVNLRTMGNENNEAQFGEFPWMIAIFHKQNASLKHIYKCGGSLIHPQIVLTAAHCVTDDGSYKIRAGEWDSQTTHEMFAHQDRKVTSIEIHRRYDRGNLQNDIALLFLASPVEITSHINVVCLHPEGSIEFSRKCLVHGWGKDSSKKNGVDKNILKKIELPIITRYDCEIAFKKTKLGKRFYLHNSFICAGGEDGKDVCIGDGGGPLVCPIPGERGRYQQVGIVSWGIGCGTEGVPGAYVSIGRLRSWIDQELTKRHFNISGYQYTL